MTFVRRTLIAGTLTGACAACVQPAYDRTVVYDLDVSARRGVHTVGVRGGDSPLSWGRDSMMTAVVPDSFYRVVITYHTGYLKTEVKFTIDGTFELEKSDNRRVEFKMNGDTTFYRARFDQAP